MVAVADALVGIVNGLGPKELRPKSEIQKRMFAMDAALRTKEPPPRLAELLEALSRATSHIPQRRVRHDHFYALLTLSESSWRERWNQMTSTD